LPLELRNQFVVDGIKTIEMFLAIGTGFDVPRDRLPLRPAHLSDGELAQKLPLWTGMFRQNRLP
jgi:hypothetical protein